MTDMQAKIGVRYLVQHRIPWPSHGDNMAQFVDPPRTAPVHEVTIRRISPSGDYLLLDNNEWCHRHSIKLVEELS